MTNQSEEILNFIKEYPGATVENIVSGTGWNRHLIEVAVKLMVEQGLVREVGQTDWLGFRYEAISKLGPSPLARAASVLSGIAAGFVNPFPTSSQLIADSREYERSLIEIAAMADVTPTEIAEFHQSTPYSLEFIKAAIQAGARLDEEDIKRTMTIRDWDTYDPISFSERIKAVERSLRQDHTFTFTVTFPNGDRREVKAAYMDVDGGTLYFEDEDHDTILAYGPGHWVWAERKEDTQTPT